MERIDITPRDHWEQKIVEQGFLFYKAESYYNESAAYSFASHEIDLIEKATAALFEMCLEVVEHVINNNLWDAFFIPREYAPLIKWSWENDMPSIYGRFDLIYNNGEIKLLEFNADTPTSLLEASVIQWYWLQDYDHTLDQFNSIHEKLLAHINNCKQFLLPGKLHFSGADDTEDYMTVKYLQDIAAQAGLDTDFILINDIGVDKQNRFADNNGELLKNVFKLYPYEWMFREPFGKYLISNYDQCYWIEPPYKAILSNKMLLKYLYDMFPASPYLLPCHITKHGFTDYVKKPIYSREGANISIVSHGKVLEQTRGDYGKEGYIYQQYFESPDFNGYKAVIGSWLIGGVPAGIGIRESKGLITNNLSHFCPHFIK